MRNSLVYVFLLAVLGFVIGPPVLGFVIGSHLVVSAPAEVLHKVGSVDRPTLHKAMHYIVQKTLLSGAGCTAYAIGPHALLTATHCELGNDIVEVDGAKVHINGHIRDGNDHSIYLVNGIKFSEIAQVSMTKPQQGDRLFMWGNPAGLKDQYREGYVTGTEPNVGDDGTKGYVFLVDMQSDHGDSGSAIFNADGMIVGVLSIGISDQQMHLMGMFPMNFSPAQVQQAKEY